MDIHILSLWEAVHFKPTKPAYGIRINSTYLRRVPELEHEKLFRCIHTYTFNYTALDTPEQRATDSPFSESIAQLMINDFVAEWMSCDALVIHCLSGKNRSPAAAIALNELFGLGQDTAALQAQYPRFDLDVYNILKTVGERTLRSGTTQTGKTI